MRQIDISFIIPVYNCSKYIQDCVKSIYKCSKYSIECILVDDGSSDGSGELCDEIEKEYETVIVVHKQNGGVSSARNCGIEKACGRYITFVDGDDYLDNIEEMFLTTDKDLYTFGMQTLEGNKKKQIEFSHKTIQEDLIKYPVYMNSVCNKFFRRAIIEKYNIRFDEQQYATEDLMFVMNFLVHSESLENVNRPYYVYRMDGNSVTHKKFTRETALNNVNAARKIENILRESNDYNSFLRYLRIKTAFPFIMNKECFDPKLYRKCVKSGDVWTFDARIDKIMLSIFAQIKADSFLKAYIELRSVLR